jgi:uncharacterized protein (TIGR02271 family)
MFDSRSQAEAARERLTQSRIDADDVRIVDQSASGQSGSPSGSDSGEGQGLWSAIKSAFIPPEDSHTYEEGMRRGGYLLCARVDEDCADEAIRILDESDSVDLEERENSWRSEGWSPYQATGGTAGFQQNQQSQQSQQSGRTVAEEHIPIVEEELRVGKREVERGGARVRSYVTETPVSEQVNLREEHVSVERRPVEGDSARSGLQSGDMFQDREISMTETAEEAVVDKEARVREELVVRKTAEEHVETVQDNVRHTEVEVDEGVRETAGRSAFGSFGGTPKSGTDDDRSRSESFEKSDKGSF